jgi:hypothetical protein
MILKTATKLKVWWHAATLFIYFTITEHTYNIFIYNTRRLPLLISSLLPLGRGPPLGCRAEIRTRLAIQQADALLSEPRCTLATPQLRNCFEISQLFFFFSSKDVIRLLQVSYSMHYRETASPFLKVFGEKMFIFQFSKDPQDYTHKINLTLAVSRINRYIFLFKRLILFFVTILN